MANDPSQNQDEQGLSEIGSATQLDTVSQDNPLTPPESAQEGASGPANPPNAPEPGAPQPPLNWHESSSPLDNTDVRFTNSNTGSQANNPPEGYIGNTRIVLSADEFVDFEAARKLVSLSQIFAVVSLFFGGVVLGSAALVMAVMGFAKLRRLAMARPDDAAARAALQRSGILAVALCILALAVESISLAIMYPVMMQALQTGDFSALTGAGQVSVGSAPSGNATWG